MVSVEVVFLLFLCFLAVEVLVLVFCAKTTVPVSSDRPNAAIMIFFMVIKSLFIS